MFLETQKKVEFGVFGNLLILSLLTEGFRVLSLLTYLRKDFFCKKPRFFYKKKSFLKGFLQKKVEFGVFGDLLI